MVTDIKTLHSTLLDFNDQERATGESLNNDERHSSCQDGHAEFLRVTVSAKTTTSCCTFGKFLRFFLVLTPTLDLEVRLSCHDENVLEADTRY